MELIAVNKLSNGCLKLSKNKPYDTDRTVVFPQLLCSFGPGMDLALSRTGCFGSCFRRYPSPSIETFKNGVFRTEHCIHLLSHLVASHLEKFVPFSSEPTHFGILAPRLEDCQRYTYRPVQLPQLLRYLFAHFFLSLFGSPRSLFETCGSRSFLGRL